MIWFFLILLLIEIAADEFGREDIAGGLLTAMVLELDSSIVAARMVVPQYCVLQTSDIYFCQYGRKELLAPTLLDVIDSAGTLYSCVVPDVEEPLAVVGREGSGYKLIGSALPFSSHSSSDELKPALYTTEQCDLIPNRYQPGTLTKALEMPADIVKALALAYDVVERWNIIIQGNNKIVMNQLLYLRAEAEVGNILTQLDKTKYSKLIGYFFNLMGNYKETYYSPQTLNNSLKVTLQNSVDALELLRSIYANNESFSRTIDILTNGSSYGMRSTLSKNNGEMFLSSTFQTYKYVSWRDALLDPDPSKRPNTRVLANLSDIEDVVQYLLSLVDLLFHSSSELFEKDIISPELSIDELFDKLCTATFAILEKKNSGTAIPYLCTAQYDISTPYMQADVITMHTFIQLIILSQYIYATISVHNNGVALLSPSQSQYVAITESTFFSSRQYMTQAWREVTLIKDRFQDSNLSGLFSVSNDIICYYNLMTGLFDYAGVLLNTIEGSNETRAILLHYLTDFPLNPSFGLSSGMFSCMTHNKENMRGFFAQSLLSANMNMTFERTEDGLFNTSLLSENMRAVSIRLKQSVSSSNDERVVVSDPTACWLHPESETIKIQGGTTPVLIPLFPPEYVMTIYQGAIDTRPLDDRDINNVMEVFTTQVDFELLELLDPIVLRLQPNAGQRALSGSTIIRPQTQDKAKPQLGLDCTIGGVYRNTVTNECNYAPQFFYSPDGEENLIPCANMAELQEVLADRVSLCSQDVGCEYPTMESGAASQDECAVTCKSGYSFVRHSNICLKLPAGVYERDGNVLACPSASDLNNYVYDELGACKSYQAFDAIVPFNRSYVTECSILSYLRLTGMTVNTRYTILGIVDGIKLDVVEEDGGLHMFVVSLCDDMAADIQGCGSFESSTIFEASVQKTDVIKIAMTVGQDKIDIVWNDEVFSVACDMVAFEKREKYRDTFNKLTGAKYPLKRGVFVGPYAKYPDNLKVSSPTIEILELTITEYPVDVSQSSPHNDFTISANTIQSHLTAQYLQPQDYLQGTKSRATYIFQPTRHLDLSDKCTIGNRLTSCTNEIEQAKQDIVYEAMSHCSSPFTELNEYYECTCPNGQFMAITASAIKIGVLCDVATDHLCHVPTLCVSVYSYVEDKTQTFDNALAGVSDVAAVKSNTCVTSKGNDCSKVLSSSGYQLNVTEISGNEANELNISFKERKILSHIVISSDRPVFVSLTLVDGESHDIVSNKKLSEVNGKYTIVITQFPNNQMQKACVTCPEHSVFSKLDRLSIRDCVCEMGYELRDGKCVPDNSLYLFGEEGYAALLNMSFEPNLFVSATTFPVDVQAFINSRPTNTRLYSFEEKSLFASDACTGDILPATIPNDPGRLYYVVGTEDKNYSAVPVHVPCGLPMPQFSKTTEGGCSYKLLNYDTILDSIHSIAPGKFYLNIKRDTLDVVEMERDSTIHLVPDALLEVWLSFSHPTYSCESSQIVQLTCEGVPEDVEPFALFADELRDFITEEDSDIKREENIQAIMLYSVYANTFSLAFDCPLMGNIKELVTQLTEQDKLYANVFISTAAINAVLDSMNAQDLGALSVTKLKSSNIPTVYGGTVLRIETSVFAQDRDVAIQLVHDSVQEAVNTGKLCFLHVPEVETLTLAKIRATLRDDDEQMAEIDIAIVPAVDDGVYAAYKRTGEMLTITPDGSDALLIFVLDPSALSITSASATNVCIREASRLKVSALASSVNTATTDTPYLVTGPSLHTLSSNKTEDILCVLPLFVDMPDTGSYVVVPGQPSTVITLYNGSETTTALPVITIDKSLAYDPTIYLIPSGDVEEALVLGTHTIQLLHSEDVQPETLYFFVTGAIAIGALCVLAAIVCALVHAGQHLMSEK